MLAPWFSDLLQVKCQQLYLQRKTEIVNFTFLSLCMRVNQQILASLSCFAAIMNQKFCFRNVPELYIHYCCICFKTWIFFYFFNCPGCLSPQPSFLKENFEKALCFRSTSTHVTFDAHFTLERIALSCIALFQWELTQQRKRISLPNCFDFAPVGMRRWNADNEAGATVQKSLQFIGLNATREPKLTSQPVELLPKKKKKKKKEKKNSGPPHLNQVYLGALTLLQEVCKRKGVAVPTRRRPEQQIQIWRPDWRH